VTAREIEIGHLETKDDPDAISSWVFFHCEENNDVLICDAFQTLISHELQPEERNSEIEKQMRGDPVKAVRESMGKEACDKMKAEIAQVSKIGKGLDGRPLDAKALQDYTLPINAMIDACTNPTDNTVRRMIEILTDRKIRTCKVSNFYSKMRFKWNEQTQKWFSQEGPLGPCGTINIFTLETDKEAEAQVGLTSHNPRSSRVWLYTQKRLFTNPSAQLPNGLACSKFSEHVTLYTWRTSAKIGECRYIEHQVQ
jgi:hypothetical protein